jgi:circadian clock protein KaiC
VTRTDRSGGRGPIRGIATGVPGLDAVLGGGLPEFSFNMIAGSPGTGKTTLAQQIVFANATPARPALYFTVLGEPTLKMLRYQQEYAFFDREMVGSAVQYLNLSEEVLEQDLRVVLARIVAEVERAKPGIIVVDSFRTITAGSPDVATADTMTLDHFVQRLALHLTSWEVTSFLLGEYAEQEHRNPVFTVADGVLWLTQVTDRNSVVRKLQIMKVRGRAPMPGLHTFRMTDNGLQVYPRIPQQQFERRQQSVTRLQTGVPGLDEIMGGGIPSGDAIILAGPAGSGKTTFATQFVAEGLRTAQPGIVVVFEEYPEEYLARAQARNGDIREMLETGLLKIIYLRPLDLSVDETLGAILEGVEEIGAQRVVIDSLSGFEVALAPAFREDFRESLYRLVGALTATGVTVFMTVETTGGHTDMGFTTERVSFITDDIIVQRFVEIEGELRRVLAVVKMRGSEHSHEFRTYEVTPTGAVIGEPLRSYHGIMSGMPELRTAVPRTGYDGLTEREAAVFDTMVRLGSASLDVLAARFGAEPSEMIASLERLESLAYIRLTKKGGTTYRAVAQSGGGGRRPG